MWRLWLLTGQTIGFVAVATPVMWATEPPGFRLGLPRLLLIALVLSGLFHFLALEAFTYSQANRAAVSDYARMVGGWRYLRGGILFGAVGAAAGSFVGWVLGGPSADYGWLALLCPVLALVAAVGWASDVPEPPRQGAPASRARSA